MRFVKYYDSPMLPGGGLPISCLLIFGQVSVEPEPHIKHACCVQQEEFSSGYDKFAVCLFLPLQTRIHLLNVQSEFQLAKKRSALRRIKSMHGLSTHLTTYNDVDLEVVASKVKSLYPDPAKRIHCISAGETAMKVEFTKHLPHSSHHGRRMLALPSLQ